MERELAARPPKESKRRAAERRRHHRSRPRRHGPRHDEPRRAGARLRLRRRQAACGASSRRTRAPRSSSRSTTRNADRRRRRATSCLGTSRRSVLTTPPFLAEEDGETAVAVNLRWYLANSVYRRLVKGGTDPDRIVFLSLHADARHPSLRGAMVYVPGARFPYAARWATRRRPTCASRRSASCRASATRRATGVRSEAVSRKLAASDRQGAQDGRPPDPALSADPGARHPGRRGVASRPSSAATPFRRRCSSRCSTSTTTEDAALLGRAEGPGAAGEVVGVGASPTSRRAGRGRRAAFLTAPGANPTIFRVVRAWRPPHADLRIPLHVVRSHARGDPEVNDKPLKKCTECSGPLEKLISRSAFQLKGGGWYNEGYGGQGGSSSTSSSSPPSSSTDAASKPDKTTGTKSEKPGESGEPAGGKKAAAGGTAPPVGCGCH